MIKRKKIYWICFLLILILPLSSCKDNRGQQNQSVPKELAELNKQIEKSSKNADLLNKRAHYYFNHGNTDEALADILAAIKLKPENSDYHVFLSDIYFSKKETDLTEENLQKAIMLDENNNEARLKLAELYFHLRMIEESMKTLDDALRLQPHNPKANLIRAFNLKDMRDTIGYLRILQLVIDQDPTEVKAFLELGYFYQQKLDPIAVSYYQNALRVDPTNMEINYNLAMLYQDLGEKELAEQQYNTILQFSPENKYALNNLGYIKSNFDENYEEAITYFTRSIVQDSSFLYPFYNRGIAYVNLREYGKAREDLLYCRNLNPEFEPAIVELNKLDDMIN